MLLSFVWSHALTSHCFREPADSSGLAALVGDYRVRCLFSRTWALRDAAVNKIRMLMENDYKNEPGVAALLNPLVLVMRTGLEDKIAQVFFSTAALMEEYFGLTKTYDFDPPIALVLHTNCVSLP